MSNSHFLLPAVLNPGRESKVGNLDVHRVSDEHVTKLEVSMQHVSTMQVLTASDQLTQEVTDLRLQ